MNNNPTELLEKATALVEDSAMESSLVAEQIISLIQQHDKQHYETKVREAIVEAFGSLPYKDLALKAAAEVFK